MKYFIILSLILSALFPCNVNAQAKFELKNTYYEAESWFLYEDYKEALPLYLTLLRVFPQNANIKYRIGQCYLNIPGEKEKSVTYLEQAVKTISPDYKKGKFSETKAPYDALFYLANAYLVNNRLEKALEIFNFFQKNLNPEVYDTAIVRLQIKSCLNAASMLTKPVYLKEQNLGEFINRQYSEFNPVISDDEKMLVFTRSYPFYDALLYSVRDESGNWSEPMNMNEILKVDNYLYPTSISHDGKDLYLYSAVGYDGIIYKTRYENGKWSPVEKLNDHINTKYWESHATISHDNKKLYFTSNRKGTYGGLDIYVSERDSSGRWGVARNLGPTVNTPYNEESPFLSIDDNTLYFSSRGHYGMGGYDYFYSNLLENGQWSVPLNVGYPMNTTDDDVFFRPINDGYQGYVARYNPHGFGKEDIYKVEMFSDEHPRKFIAEGIAKTSFPLLSKSDGIEIIARDASDPEKKPVEINADPETGEFIFKLPHGNYELTYNIQGAVPQKRNLSIPIDSQSDTIIIPSTILSRPEGNALLAVKAVNNRAVIRKSHSSALRLKTLPVKRLTVASKLKRVDPPQPAIAAKYTGISKIPENKLVSLQIPIRIAEKPSFYAGFGQPGVIIASSGAFLVLLFLLYRRRRKRAENME